MFSRSSQSGANAQQQNAQLTAVEQEQRMRELEERKRKQSKRRAQGKGFSNDLFADMAIWDTDGNDVVDAMSLFTQKTVDWTRWRPKLKRFLDVAVLNTHPKWTPLSYEQKSDLWKWFQWTHRDMNEQLEQYPNPAPLVSKAPPAPAAASALAANDPDSLGVVAGSQRTLQNQVNFRPRNLLENLQVLGDQTRIAAPAPLDANALAQQVQPSARMGTGAFWHYPSEEQMNASWRKPMSASGEHRRHPGKRMSVYRASHKTGASMPMSQEYVQDHETTVKELAMDLHDKLPLGLSLALRAATGNSDLVSAASKIHTRNGKIDYAGALKKILPESVTQAAAIATEVSKNLKTGDIMQSNAKAHATGSAQESWDAELVKSLDQLQKQLPVWQKPRILALREFVHKNFDREQHKTQNDVNISASQFIARLGILRAVEKAKLRGKYKDLIAVHLK